MCAVGIPLPLLLLLPKEAITPLVPVMSPVVLRNTETPDIRMLDGALPPPDFMPIVLLPAAELAMLIAAMPPLACARKPT